MTAWRWLAVPAALATCLLLVACGTHRAVTEAASARAHNGTVQVWTTTGDKTRLLAREPDLFFGTPAVLPLHIDVDATRQFQVMAGFGASITDATA